MNVYENQKNVFKMIAYAHPYAKSAFFNGYDKNA